MKNILFILFLHFSLDTSAGIHRCEASGYNYTGVNYSDSYALPKPPLPEACKGREKIDAKQLGEVYRENNAKLTAIINQIIANPKCLPLHDPLKQYLQNVAFMRNKYEEDAKARLELLNKTASFFDMQKDYAHMAAFSATCAAEEHRGAAMVDLDGINQITNSGGGSTEVKSNGELVDDCSDVRAFGKNDLNGFRISLKNAKGDSFLFMKDAFSIPDQVILKTSSGSVLYDSGCQPGNEEKKISLSSVSGDKIVTVEIIGSCANHGHKATTAWFVGFQCTQDQRVCPDEVDQLMELMKKQIEFTKSLINIHSMELSCYRHYDVNILKDLKARGLIDIRDDQITNGPCSFFDFACKSKFEEELNKEKNRNSEMIIPFKPEALTPPPAAKRLPPKLSFDSREIFDAHCPHKIISTDSVLKLVSRTYCTVGYRKLGMNLDSFE